MGQYSHVTRVRAGEFLFIAGMLSGDAKGNVIGEGDFDAQTAQVFRNIEAALKSAGASWANVVQFTTYLVHRRTFRNSWHSACANFQGCSPMASTRRIRFSWSIGW